MPKHIMAHTTFGPPDTLLNCFNPYLLGPILPQFAFFSYCLAYQYENSKIILEKAHSCFQQQPTLYISAQHAY